MKVPARIVMGQGSAPRGAIATLALDLAQRARSHGLTVVHIRCSRIRMSVSKHILLRDPRGRNWHLRVSDHYLPRKSGHERPHFDLITPNGRDGAEQAFGFVDKLGRGEITWVPPVMAPKRRGQR